MATDMMTVFETLQEAKEFLAAKSVADKKPFRVKKSDPSRLDVVCEIQTCTFQLNIVSDHEGLFHISKSIPHSCNSVNPTLKKSWICLKISEMFPDNPRITTDELFAFFKREFGINVPKQMLVKANAQSRSQ